ncbi:MAG: YfcC family protein [Myxococcales bacterium FL481]|nr:MAG: YfcC family protein [Myxococcales bacterium FL481]
MRSRVRVPHTLVLLFSMIVLAWLATYLLPHGEFERVERDHHKVVVPGSFSYLTDDAPLSPVAVLTAVPSGFTEARDIIFFVFIIGGTMAVLRRTGTIDAVLGLTLERFGTRPNVLIAVAMLVFTVGSSTLGMAEEYIPFVAVLVGLCAGLGMDPVTAIGIMVCGYGVGYGTAAINPFTVVPAQEVAGLAPTSGAWFRVAIMVPLWGLGFLHVSRYAARVRADRSASLVADLEPSEGAAAANYPRLTRAHLAVLALTVASVALLVYGISSHGWYLQEMGAMFLGLTLVTAVVARLSPDVTAKAFVRGAEELTVTALLIGFARAIQVVLEQGHVIDTIVHGVAGVLEQFGPSLAAVCMYFIQSLCNFFIPSGSGQAYVTMPVMAPIADLTGVSRQVAVLAFQFGDGFTNMLVPTNAVLIGILGIAKIPYDRWLRFIVPFMVQMWIAGSVVLLVAVSIGLR